MYAIGVSIRKHRAVNIISVALITDTKTELFQTKHFTAAHFIAERITIIIIYDFGLHPSIPQYINIPAGNNKPVHTQYTKTSRDTHSSRRRQTH